VALADEPAPSENEPETIDTTDASETVKVEPLGRLRFGYEWMAADPDLHFVGQNNGFFLHQARVGLQGNYKNRIHWRLTLDAAHRLEESANDPITPLGAAARDAYMHWRATDWLNLWFGQTYMPADYEGMVSRRHLNFVDRSVASMGVRAGQGYQVRGLSAGRELGVVLGAQDWVAGQIHLDYRLALSNGNGGNILGNDNKLPAFYGRFGVGFKEFVHLAVGAQYNPRSVGALPNRYQETDSTLLGDLHISFEGIDFLAQAIYRQTTFDTTDAALEEATGYTVWVVLDEPFGVPMFWFKPGYRISLYDPSTLFYDDQLVEHTVGVRYDPPIDLPLAFRFDYTWLIEDQARSLPNNDRFVTMVQLDY